MNRCCRSNRYFGLLPALLGLLLLLAARPLPAQGDEEHPRYRFRAGGKAQVRRLFRYEEYEHPSPGYVRFRQRTSTARLLRLTQHRNPARRVYAALALIDRRYLRLAAVFGDLMRTDQLIVMNLRDVVTNAELPEEFYLSGKVYHWLETMRYAPLSAADSAYQARQLLQLDSVVLLHYSQGYPVERHVRNAAFYSNHAYPGSYAALRQLVVARLDSGRLLSSQASALAEYRRPADVGLIKRFDKSKLLSAVAEFPDPAFWPLLLPYAGPDNSLSFFNAVAAYQSPPAAQLLDSLYRHQLAASKDPLRTSLVDLSQALYAHYHPLYDSLLGRLWRERQVIASTEVHRFAQQNPAEAATLFAQGLLGFVPRGENYIVGHRSLGGREQLLIDMLRVIQQQDSALFRRVCTHSVMALNFPEFDGLCQLLQEQHPAWAIQPILARLTIVDRYPDALSTARLLFSYQDPALSQQVATALAQKPASLWEAGAWLDRLNELLRAHGQSPLPASR